MPIYQYQCDECGHLFEKLMKLSDPEPSKCPECGAEDPRRTIAQTAFQLKGGGWYVTDYKGNNPGATTTSGKDKEAGDSSSGPSSREEKSSDKSSSDKPSAVKSNPAPTKVEGAA